VTIQFDKDRQSFKNSQTDTTNSLLAKKIYDSPLEESHREDLIPKKLGMNSVQPLHKLQADQVLIIKKNNLPLSDFKLEDSHST
jgi:hypothetical protein